MIVDKRASLREKLITRQDGMNGLIAYLTLGDPVVDFMTCAQSVLDAGALTLELGIPLRNPQEGAVLLASHARARTAGIDESAALDLLAQVHEANPNVPLIAVNQWPALNSEQALRAFVTRAASAGASAVLIVGLPLALVSPFRSACDIAGIETILSCFPDTPKRMRALIYRQTTGCIYIARGRGESGGENVVSVEALCREMRAETDIPLIIGFGISDAQSVESACLAGAKAAVVGSALVERIAGDPSVGVQFVAKLTNR